MEAGFPGKFLNIILRVEKIQDAPGSGGEIFGDRNRQKSLNREKKTTMTIIANRKLFKKFVLYVLA